MSAVNHRRLAAEIIYDDADILVIAKPPRVLLRKSDGKWPAVRELLVRDGLLAADAPLYVVQKLHEQASGVVVYARTPVARKHLERQFAEGQAQVTYLALVSGHVEADGQIDIPLRFDKRLGKLQASEHGGKPACTVFRVVEHVAGNTLLECRPLRERSDQLRAHLEALGHPLTVDARFGGGVAVMLSSYKPDYRPGRRRPETPLIERLTLHAASLSFVHPASGQRMEFSVAAPKDLRATLTQLRRLR